ncbi:MAG TPA: KUP/HAK/KT family potassium transporter [Bacteroidales bacterium]|nr:KUP/HAK/KT family potassium transporter [Bacteroidales bacterium]
MGKEGRHIDIRKLSFTGVVITLGIVFGDLGTSPLYVMQAIVSGGREFNDLLIYGSMSCIFWTLTLQTTLKYVLITLRADNNGEGGIYALFALLRRKHNTVAVLTMIGASALLADGVITPAITVTSAVEGLKLYQPDIPVITIVLAIFAGLFFMQRYGTNIVGGAFGPVMVIWFLMLSVMGSVQLAGNPGVLSALNPAFAIKFLSEYPGGFLLLGAVFLATTGAEALYSDLGHCGVKNIRVSWFFVKISLLLNYFGQCAWLLKNGGESGSLNPFYGIMPGWFLIPGIFISTAAAIIASQALITGSFTLISEAVSLNFWPKFRIENPTQLKGQVYVPYVNWFLWLACSGVVVFFRKSSNMEAAYGLAITLTMIMTTTLLSYYLRQTGKTKILITQFLIIFLTIEGSFLIANLHKFSKGGWFTLLLASVFFVVMYGWYFGRKLKNRYVTFCRLENYLGVLKDLTRDSTVPKTATNLVYIVKANNIGNVESKVIYSILHKQPKRADTYWFIHVDRRDEPHTFKYKVTQIVPGKIIRVDFYLGFKVEPNINRYFREVVEDLRTSGEITLENGFEAIRKYSIPADFLYILIDRVMPRDTRLPVMEKVILKLHDFSRLFCISDITAYNLDPTSTIEEKVPIEIEQPELVRIQRIGPVAPVLKTMPVPASVNVGHQR